jgi:hypothetical protein
MATYYISTMLPRRILTELQAAPGVTTTGTSPRIINLIDSPGGETIFRNYMNEEEESEDYDPLLTPFFGHPAFPFCPPAVQAEVYDLLNTFQQLMAADFTPNAQIHFQPINAAQMVGAGVHYHHAKASMKAVIAEIQASDRFANECPHLVAVPAGNLVCYMDIAYANAVIRLRVHRL